MKSWIWFFGVWVALSGCATYQLQTDGQVNQVTWYVTDLDSGSDFGLRGDTERYSFTLVLKEIAGRDLTLKKVTWRIAHDGVDLGGEETTFGSWSLPAHGVLGQPFVYRIYCPPSTLCPDVGGTMQWDIAFEGHDAQDQPVHIALQTTLPWVPKGDQVAIANQTQPRPEAVSSPIHVTERRIYYPFGDPPRYSFRTRH